MQIKATILAKDIKETNYLYSDDCAITRALKRAGYPYRDTGLSIMEGNVNIVTESNKEYRELSNKVCEMYKHKDSELEDFDFVINL